MPTKKPEQVINVEGEKIEGKQTETTRRTEGQNRSKRRILVIFNTEKIPEKVFPAKYQKVAAHLRLVACLVTKGVALKLGLDGGSGVIFDEKEGKIKRIRGSKGAKSYKFLFPDSKDKTKVSSYSLPVPGWVNQYIFGKAIVAQLKEKGVLTDCLGIVTPDNNIFPWEAIVNPITDTEVDDPKNAQDTNKESTEGEGNPLTQQEAENPQGDAAEDANK